MVYIFDEFEKLDGCFVRRYSDALHDERCAKMQKYRSFERKMQSAVVYLLLRFALLEEYDIDEAVNFGYIKNGKPILPNYPHIHFNLSHCKTAAACAVYDSPVGIDVQHIKAVSDKVAKRVLTPTELNGYKGTPNPDELFCKIWAVKESFAKLSGDGLSTDFGSFSADSVTEKLIYKGKNYYCCVCGSGVEKANMRINKIRGEDFEQFAGYTSQRTV